MDFTDDVRGKIIGGDNAPYEFWNDEGRFARGHFDNDDEAVEYIRDHYPEKYNAGFEMRVFEGVR